MKVLRVLLLFALVCSLRSVALADTLDFRMNVLDPPGFSPSYPVYVINSLSFNVIFTPCLAGELPNGLTADGCFAGVNNSGANWIGLDMTFANTATLASQPASCAPAPSDNVFASTPNCSLNRQGTQYLLSFASGVIPTYPNTPGSNFFIAETGVAAADFPVGQAVATAAASTVPEPTPLLLALSGALLGLAVVPRLR